MSNLNSDLESTRGKMNAISSKYLSGSKKMNKKDEETMGLLKRKERALTRQHSRLENTHTGWRVAWAAVRPFMFIFGFVFILVSLLIVVSIALTNTDKAINSHHWCGAKCGFILAYPKILNPLDSLLTILQKYFPLDYIIISLLVLYIFFCTLSGIVNIGIRFLWVHMFTIRRGATAPQGILFATVILMLSVLVLNMEVTTLAPQYAQFGGQLYFNSTTNTTEQCSLNAPPGVCTMTQIGTFVNQISVRMSFFSIIFFYATWVFLGCFLIGSVVACIRSKTSNIEKREDDSDEDES
jgi:LMBR1 domain-containing protein 1